MARIAINELKNHHPGEDIWVIASGPTAGLIEPAFFESKVTVGVNRVWQRFRTTYLVSKEVQNLQYAIDSGATVIASRYHCGDMNGKESKAVGDWYGFEHAHNDIYNPDLSVIGTDRIVVSHSTTGSALHVAAYLGAANIIIVGHDCGTLDGHLHMRGYYSKVDSPADEEHLRRFAIFEKQSVLIRERLQEVYGCRVYSLNPFINLGLEGHQYVSARG